MLPELAQRYAVGRYLCICTAVAELVYLIHVLNTRKLIAFRFSWFCTTSWFTYLHALVRFEVEAKIVHKSSCSVSKIPECFPSSTQFAIICSSCTSSIQPLYSFALLHFGLVA